MLIRDAAIERARRIEHVRAHPSRSILAVALSNRLHYAVMLLTRAHNPSSLPQLRAPERVEAGADRDRLLGEKCIVGRVIQRLVKRAVERIIGIDVVSLHDG